MNETLITNTLYQLEQMEYGSKSIPAKDELIKRLAELANGRKVPVPVFNCLEFSWRPSVKRRYPKSIVSSDPNTAICNYYQDEINLVGLQLADLGQPDIKIIIPDSELLDERVFVFEQSLEERRKIASCSKLTLASTLGELGSGVMLWSEYCQSQGLKSPLDYTAENYKRIQAEPELEKKVQSQVKDSKKFLAGNLEGVDEKEIFDRTAWYLAMYMGEGQALFESQAICLNLEDRRVPTWFQKGARNRLPILTPVDPNIFYAWRRSIKGGDKL